MKQLNSNDVYVIVSSWDEVLYKLEAWSKNYYIAMTYYNKFKEDHPDALFKIYESYDRLKTLHLAKSLKEDYDASVDDFINSELKFIASEDGKLCAIYKEKYHNSFITNSTLIEETLFSYIKSSVSEVFLSSAPLIKYINTSTDLLELLFRAYNYLSTDNKLNVDMVYLWYFLISKNLNSNWILSQICGEVIPIDTVFISVK